jgi:hypothetical protein
MQWPALEGWPAEIEARATVSINEAMNEPRKL